MNHHRGNDHGSLPMEMEHSMQLIFRILVIFLIGGMSMASIGCGNGEDEPPPNADEQEDQPVPPLTE